MTKKSGMRAVGAQAVRERLGSKRMLLFVALTVCQFAAAFGVRAISGAPPLSFLVYTMIEGFVTAETVRLYLKKESRTMRHLSVYSMGMAVVMLTVFFGLTVLMIAAASAKNSLPEGMLEEWTRDYAGDPLRMLLSTALTGVTGVFYIFLRLALKQGADVMERKREERDWRKPAAYLTVLTALLSLAEELLSPLDWLSMGPEIAGFFRYIVLAVLLWPGEENG
ncbi:MAG: hypothetical protein IKQ41_11885 [Clostridia bacterium]|nr:hypothetical protein [Clostridia bacterium]